MGQIIISILVVAVWIASFWIDTSILGYSNTSRPFTHFTYMFAHISFFHMAMNVFSFNVLINVVKKVNLKIPLLTALVASFLSTFIATYDLSTVGLSGVVFALLGALLVKIRNKEFLVSIGLLFIIQVVTFIIKPYTNVLLHATSFIIGFILTYIVNYDYKRTKKGR